MLIKKIMFYKILMTILLTNSTAFANSNDYFYLECSTHNIDISLPYLNIKAKENVAKEICDVQSV